MCIPNNVLPTTLQHSTLYPDNLFRVNTSTTPLVDHEIPSSEHRQGQIINFRTMILADIIQDLPLGRMQNAILRKAPTISCTGTYDGNKKLGQHRSGNS